jgi:hypothetical protein
MKPILSFLGVLALLLLTVPAFAAANPAPNTAAPGVAAAGDCGLDLAQLLAPENAVCRDIPIGTSSPPLDLAAAPHCCASGAAEACRDLCRQQAPSCKGAISCRAGECVCTCSC